MTLILISISLNTSRIFPENILDFSSDTIENQGVINLCSDCSKIYVLVVLSYSEVTFLEEREDATFGLFIFCVVFIDNVS